MSGSQSRRASMQSGLRARAEVMVEGHLRAVPDTETALRRMVHELEVHEVELEMQADELLRAQDALQEARDRYRDVYENAPVGYLILTERGFVQETNAVARALLGAAPGLLEGRPLAALAPAADATLLHSHFRAAAQGGTALCEVRLVRADGLVIDVRLSSARVNRGGVALCTTLLDVTRRKRAERDLAGLTQRLVAAEQQVATESERAERAERRLAESEVRRANAEVALERQRGFGQRLLEAVPGWALSVDGDGRILWLNTPLAGVVGRPLAELVGADWIDELVVAEAATSARSEFHRNLGEPNAPRAFEAVLTCRDGAPQRARWQMIRFQENREGGAVLIGSALDEVDRAGQECIRRSTALAELAGDIADDFRSLLARLVRHVDAAGSHLSGGHRAEAPLRDARTAALRAVNSIRCLQVLAQTPPVRRVVDLNALISRMEPLLRLTLGEDVPVSMSLEVPSAISCHSHVVEGMLLGLAVNAKRAMPHGGRVTISTRVDTVAAERAARLAVSPGRYVVLSITDTGDPSRPRVGTRLLGPFLTGGHAPASGSFGLSPVLAAVREYGGGVLVERVPGGGVNLRLYFPQSSELPTSPAATVDVSERDETLPS